MTGYYLAAFYVTAIRLNFGIYSTIFATASSSAIGLLVYWLNFTKGRAFKNYWRQLEHQEMVECGDGYIKGHEAILDEKVEHNASIGNKVNCENQSEKDQSLLDKDKEQGDIVNRVQSEAENKAEIKDEKTPEKKQGPELSTWWGFIKFNSLFSFNGLLQSVWWQIDGFTVSVLFDPVQVAAQISLSGLARLLEYISVGYCMPLSTTLSRQMVKRQIKKAKATS